MRPGTRSRRRAETPLRADAATRRRAGRSVWPWRSTLFGIREACPERELAERLGTTQSTIARLEAGNVTPSLATLDKIAAALGVELIVSFVDLDDRLAG